MGVPSTQASNAIIYLTYGGFLYACILCDFPESSCRTIATANTMSQSALPGFTLPGAFDISPNPNFCRAIGHKRVRYTTHHPRNDLTGSMLNSILSLHKTRIIGCQPEIDVADRFLPAIPLALNFIASGECISACATAS